MWRISFGALLSLVALVCITLYHQLNNSLNTLRGEVANVNAKSATLVSKDEFNSRLTGMNQRNETLQKNVTDLEKANVVILTLRDRSEQLEKRLNASDADRKELEREVRQLRERIAVLETRRAKDPAAKKPAN
jgi:peptidoglycan hydrolase CwlO-like protein